jgi:2-polyprenyl-3-methyl-5-hydroxy-6-metoxy-1,4-benzoquinol methylase
MITGKYMSNRFVQLTEESLKELQKHRNHLLSVADPKFEEVNCPLCNSNSPIYIVGEDAKGIVGQCKECDLVYAYSRATEPVLNALYKFYLPSNLTDPTVRQSQEVSRPAELNDDLDCIERYVERGNLLDIGASSGDFLVYGRIRGWKVEATELSELCAEFMATCLEIPVHCGNILDIEFEDRKYKAITLRHSVEHLREPIKELKALHKALSNDGLLFVTTPEHARDLELIKENHMLPLHIVNYTKETLELLFSKTGFKMTSYESQDTGNDIKNMRVTAVKEC